MNIFCEEKEEGKDHLKVQLITKKPHKWLVKMITMTYFSIPIAPSFYNNKGIKTQTNKQIEQLLEMPI